MGSQSVTRFFCDQCSKVKEFVKRDAHGGDLYGEGWRTLSNRNVGGAGDVHLCSSACATKWAVAQFDDSFPLPEVRK